MATHPKDAKDFKKKTKYTIVVGHKFEGKFIEYVTEYGVTYAIFDTGGKTDHGEPAQRKVAIDNILRIGI